jgi:hypothetical protein
MSTLLHVLGGLGIAVAAASVTVLLSILLIRAKLPIVAPGSLAGPVIVAVIAYLLIGIAAAIASGIAFLLLGIVLHPIVGAILPRFGGRSPYFPPDS